MWPPSHMPGLSGGGRPITNRVPSTLSSTICTACCAGLLWLGAVGGRAPTRGAAVPPPAGVLPAPHPDAATAAPAHAGHPPGLATRRSAAATGARDRGRPALDRPLHVGVAGPAHWPGCPGAALPPPDRTSRVSPALDQGGPPDLPHTAAVCSCPGRASRDPCGGGQGITPGGAPGDGAQGRWRPPVCGRTDQDRARVRAAPGAGGTLRALWPPATPGDPGDASRCADGALGPPGDRQSGGAAGRDDGAHLCL